MAVSLGHFLPNVGGPSAKVRRLYAYTVQSVLLYGTPAWAEAAMASRSICSMLHCSQRRLAIRIIHAYRTVSFAAATNLAGLLPAELQANSYAYIFRRTKDPERIGRACLPSGIVIQLRRRAHQVDLPIVQINLINPKAGHWTIQPCLPQWADRRVRGLTFHMSQMLTNHGCFGEYMHMIGKEHTTGCHHCAAGQDSARHTLMECPAWDEERGALAAVVGPDLSLPAHVLSVLEGEDKWDAVSSFYDKVMSQKE